MTSALSLEIVIGGGCCPSLKREAEVEAQAAQVLAPAETETDPRQPEKPQFGPRVGAEGETDLVGVFDLQWIVAGTIDSGAEIMAVDEIEADVGLIAGNREPQRVACIETESDLSELTGKLEISCEGVEVLHLGAKAEVDFFDRPGDEASHADTRTINPLLGSTALGMMLA